MVVFCLFVSCVTEGEAVEKAPAASSGSAVKFEGTTEEDASAATEETGEQQHGLYQTKVALNVALVSCTDT